MPKLLDHEARAATLLLIRQGRADPGECAKLFGVSRQLVRAWVIRAGLQKILKKRHAAHWKKLRGLREYAINEVARRNLSVRRVAK